MARAECPRAIAREISSRSSKLKHLSGRRRALGRMPPVLARWLLTLPPRKAEPAPDLAIAQPLRSQLPDPVLRGLAQAEAPRHHRTSLDGRRAADSPGWCGGGLRPPMKAPPPLRMSPKHKSSAGP